MADISEWSPVDESNNQAPPNGFPEFMAPSALNNGARAMMGAVRRWYDAITAQLASLTASLAQYLPIAGGTITGSLGVIGTINTTDTYQFSGGNFARRSGDGYTHLYDYTGVLALALGPDTTYYRANNHYFQNDTSVTVASINSAGRLTAINAVDTTQYFISGTLFAERVGSTAHHIYDVGGNLAVALHAGENYYRADAHRWQTEAGTEVATLTSAGALTLLASVSAPTVAASGAISAANVNATGTVTAGTVTSAANVNATTVNTGTVTASGNVNATSGTVNAATVAASGTVSGNLLTGGSVNSNSTSNATQFNLRSLPFASMDAGAANTVLYDPSGAANITIYAAAGGTNYYDQNHHEFRNRGGSTRYCYFNAGGTFNALGGPWGMISEAGLKEDITPYDFRGLDACLALDPVSFVYRAGVPFADEARTVRYGLLADAVAPVLPECVGEAEFEIDGALRTVQTLQLGPLTFVLLNAVKELAARIEALEGDP